jgi:hypothetical protein
METDPKAFSQSYGLASSGPFTALGVMGNASLSLLFRLNNSFTGTASLVLAVREVPGAAAAAAAGWPAELLPAAPLVSRVAFNLTVQPVPSAPTLPGYQSGSGQGPVLYTNVAAPDPLAVARRGMAALAASRAGWVGRTLVGALRAGQSGYEAVFMPAVYTIANATGQALVQDLAVSGAGSLVCASDHTRARAHTQTHTRRALLYFHRRGRFFC